MRTKTLLCLAALTVAGVTASMAQSSNVYSLNVVGYVNVPILGGGQYNMIANPLTNTAVNGNSISTLFAGKAGEGDLIFRWDVVNYNFQGVQPIFSGGAWDLPFDLLPGEGIWYINANADFTNTFVGDVIQTPITRTLVGGGSYNAIGSTVPLGGSFTNSLGGFTPGEGDLVFTWDVVNYNWNGVQPIYSGGAWDDTTVQQPAGSGFIYINNNSDIVWTRNYTVPQ